MSSIIYTREAKANTKPETVERRYLNYTQASQYSGLSEVTIRRLIARGELKSYCPGRTRKLIDRRELDSYIAASQGEPSGKGIGRGR